jgi:hypothetical protein
MKGWPARKKFRLFVLALIWFGLAQFTPNWVPYLKEPAIVGLGFNWFRCVYVTHEEISLGD